MAGNLSEHEAATLRDLWQELSEEFFVQIAAAPAQRLELRLRHCLLGLERWFGGAEARDWKERDYQQVLLAQLTSQPGLQAVGEAVPGDRQRLDILLGTTEGRRERAVLELKFHDPSRLHAHITQLRAYAASLGSGGSSVQAHLILLDREPQPAWSEPDRRTQEGEIVIWRVHVGRQPPSKR